MEKLSSILPASPRVKSVDLKAAQPVRPGVPRFGRPEGLVSRDRLSLSPEAKEMAFKETLAARNPREAQSAKIAEEVTAKFFQNRLDRTPAAESAIDRVDVVLGAPVDPAAEGVAGPTAEVPASALKPAE